ncbi:MAG: DUF362 domain-containing protein [Acidobacteriota bacterium]
MSVVYFIPLTLKDDPQKIERAVLKLFRATGLPEKIQKNDVVAIKMHFGEEKNHGYIKPRYAAVVSKEIIRVQGKPFFTDTNTLYVGKRSNAVDHLLLAYKHGFIPDVLYAPVIIADGLLGNAEVKVKINGKHFKDVPIARELAFCDGIVSLNHFTGHVLTHFGAALKNLGMGGSARSGKLLQHSAVKPVVNPRKCTGCEVCIPWCSTGSIKMDGDKAIINLETCIGCGQCLSVCKFEAISFKWNESSELVQEKMVEHVLGVLKGKEDKSTHITFLTHITKECDCMAEDEPAIMEDIGLLASNDPVALDKASLDCIEERIGKEFGELISRSYLPLNQINYAELLNLGSPNYELQTMKV